MIENDLNPRIPKVMKPIDLFQVNMNLTNLGVQ
jgi:hypothetical protein